MEAGCVGKRHDHFGCSREAGLERQGAHVGAVQITQARESRVWKSRTGPRDGKTGNNK